MAHPKSLDPAEKMRLLEQLSGRRLSAVAFSLNHIRLQFDPPLTITAYTQMSVRPNGEPHTESSDVQFQHLLRSQISKEVGLVTVVNEKSFALLFEDSAGVSISLKQDDYSGSVAVTVEGTNGYWLEI